MKKGRSLLLLLPLLAAATVLVGEKYGNPFNDRIISYTVDPAAQHCQFYFKDDKGQTFGSIQHLKDQLEQQRETLVFAMNGGMFKADHSPQGLFIQQQRVIVPLDTTAGDGNFYLKPNGVLYITTDGKAGICSTSGFTGVPAAIAYATQSGPMLLIDGKMHPAFRQGSTNLNIRNGVGVLPDHRLIFAMSKEPINFYDFAEYFKQLGCKDALYLDGFVSRMYLPSEGWVQTDGDFGVIIGVTK